MKNTKKFSIFKYRQDFVSRFFLFCLDKCWTQNIVVRRRAHFFSKRWQLNNVFSKTNGKLIVFYSLVISKYHCKFNCNYYGENYFICQLYTFQRTHSTASSHNNINCVNCYCNPISNTGLLVMPLVIRRGMIMFL